MLHGNRDISTSLTSGLSLARKVDVAFMQELLIKIHSPVLLLQLGGKNQIVQSISCPT